MVQVWDVKTGGKKHTLGGHWEMVFSVAFSPDGRTLASGGRDEMVRVWDAVTGERKRTLTEHVGLRNWVNSVAFSPDGGVLASGSDSGIICVWKVQ